MSDKDDPAAPYKFLLAELNDLPDEPGTADLADILHDFLSMIIEDYEE